jgi:hypothetical protein
VAWSLGGQADPALNPFAANQYANSGARAPYLVDTGAPPAP